MLNEIGEYEHYTLSPQQIDACRNLRLKHMTLIKQSFSGLERALTTIARHFIFDTPLGTNETELREIFKAWCGFKHEAKNLPEHFEGWLVHFICRVFLAKNVKACLKEISEREDAENFTDLKAALEKISPDGNFDHLETLETVKIFKEKKRAEFKEVGDEPTQILAALTALVKLANKNNGYSKSVFGSSNEKGENLFRAITYDRIIANALLTGKLRRFYLVCDEELFTTKKILKSSQKDSKKLSANDKDMILKMTAEYLLKRHDTSQLFVETNDSNMVNWLTGVKKPENFNREKYLLGESGEKIFEMRKVNPNGINATKFKIHPEWTKHFRLVEDCEENIEEKLGRIFFSDVGSCEKLQEGVRYEDLT